MKAPLRILWVDDEQLLTEIMTELLSEEGITCLTAEDAEKARGLLEKEDFDLLIFDFQMPQMSGAELLKWCRKNGKNHPVIFISGAVERSEEEELALKDRSASLLTKPFALEKLLEEIRKALRDLQVFESDLKQKSSDLS